MIDGHKHARRFIAPKADFHKHLELQPKTENTQHFYQRRFDENKQQ